LRVVPLVRDDDSFFRSDQPALCPLLGAEVPVAVYTDGAGVQPDQFHALAGFLGISAGERIALAGRLFADYREVRDAVGEGPEIAGPDRVWEFVRWTTILVPLQGPTGSRFVFVQGVAAWEEEHGVELLFRDERLVRLGRASGAFLSSCFWSWT
jgi:hypothetical protein